MAIELNLNDLQFVLKQIKIGEAHANGAALTEIRLNPLTGEVITDGAQYDANGMFLGDATLPRAIPDAKTPFGIRTVDGSYNNLMEGRELWGAADQPMPRYLDPNYIDGGPETPFSFGPGPLQDVTNTDYSIVNGVPTFPGTGLNGGHTGNVVDSDPRTISNLVVDMSVNNPAAIYSALVFAESADPYADLAELLAARISQAEANAALATATGNLSAAELALDAAIAAFDGVNFDPIQAAAELLSEAEADLAHAQTVAANPEQAFLDLAASKGLEIVNGSLVIPNVAPDEGISAPFNAWMTFFGQFFDHGLDLISKGGNGTVFMPLKDDDPLVLGADGMLGTADDLPAHLRFMVLTRSTTVLDENGQPTQVNTTTPFVDQNQTYTSHASHQVFLREYHLVGGVPAATGRLLEGASGGLATWADIKAQAASMLGIQLTDGDVVNIPLIYTDAYGEFIRGANGLPQIVTSINPDGTPATTVEGNTGAPVNTFGAGAMRIGHAFLDDIAHAANPINSQTGGLKLRDTDGVINDTDANGVVDVPMAAGQSLTTHFDGDLLDRHFITGDGRGNENFGLTAVHHVFHSEHNRQTVIQKLKILEEGDLAFINEWLVTDLTAGELSALHTALDAAVDKNAFIEGLALNWDGERIFQAARFATEMQYQHLVFEEFGRKIQPAIDPFVFNSVTDINPAIFAEFANVVYRFGHSMLTDALPRSFYDPLGTADTSFLNTVDNGLIAAFLDPVDYDLNGTISHEQAAGAIIRGLTNVRGNAIDEFVVDALRNNLLGLPLDLASINIARGRDTGMPTLNQAREQLFAATGQSFLRPYNNWADFAVGLKNPLSVVNFVAAYGTHSALLAATDLATKRDIAMELVFGVEADGVTPSDIADRLDFINGTGAYAAALGGLNNVDLWIGGLAEKILLFGGMLGSTFTAIFEAQMEALQDADRFYYLTRTQGLNFLDALENNAFSKLIMANTDLTEPGPDGIRGTADDVIRHHIGIDSFGKYDLVLEVNEEYQQDYNGADPGKDPNDIDAVLAGLGFTQVIRDLPPAFQGYYDNYLRYIGGEHVVLGGTSGRDVLIGDLGDEGIWGDAGNDFIEGGQGVDLIMGGADDDVILDEGDEGDFIKGDAGNDVIASSNGLDVLMGGEGKDVVFTGKDDTEVFGGEGDDFIMGGDGVDFLLGNEGDDWMEAGGGFDTTAGDNSQLFFNSDIIGHDVMFAGSEEHDFDAESGDDIMVQGESVMRNEGMFGFDWASFQGATFDADVDMRIRIFTTEEADILRNRFDKVEALSGGEGDDTLRGDDREAGPPPAVPTVNNTETLFYKDELSQAGLDRIEGLRALLGNLVSGVPVGDSESVVAFTGGNILLGAAGSDTIQGNGGNDFIDGSAALNVRIRLTAPGAENTAANEVATIHTLKHVFTGVEGPAIPAEWIGKSLFELLVSRAIVPAQLHIVREILADVGGPDDINTAVFNDNLQNDDGSFNYTITPNSDGTITVAHVNVSLLVDPVTGRQLISDGVDTVRNVQRLQFLDQTVVLTGPELFLEQPGGQFADSFNTGSFGNSDGSTFWGPDWIEAGDSGGVTSGQIQIDNGNNVLRLSGTGPGGAGGNNGAMITRTMDLSAATNATVSFVVNQSGLEAGEWVRVFFAADGSTFTLLEEINNSHVGTQNHAHALTGPFAVNAAIRFEVSAMTSTDDIVTIDNLVVDFATGAPQQDYEATFTEGAGLATGADVPIASNPLIIENDQVVSARIVLTNAKPGDAFDIPGDLAGNINSNVQTLAGQIIVTLTAGAGGEPDEADWQAALEQIEFRNTSQNPDQTPRIIEVTLNDGFLNSQVATTTINVVGVDDVVDANNDAVITNVLPGTSFQLPKWVLLLNDVDPDNTIDVTAVSAPNGLTAALGASSVTVTDTSTPDGSFVYTATGGPATNNATVNVDTVVNAPTFSETFGDTSYTGDDGAWTDNWVEFGDDGSSTSDNGQIRINGGRLEFDVGISAPTSDGAYIQRAIAGLAGQTAATLSYSANPDSMETGEYVRVFFSRDGSEANFVQLNEIVGDGGNVNYTHNLAGPFTAAATLRFVVSTLNNTSDIVGIDNISVSFVAPVTTVNGTGGDDILVGDVNGSTFDAGTGDDVVLAGDGNDTIVWNANTATAANNNNSDERDVVDGGAGTDDTFVVNGNTNNAVAETYRVYSRAAADAAGLVVLNPDTEIVITRGGTTNAFIIAELDNIEEIVVNTDNGNDTVLVIGDFTPTSLDVNTITINGGAGDDIVDFSALTSAHRIVFRSNGGNDTVVGTVRPQDIIQLANGEDISNYTLTDNGDGTQTYSNGTHSITFAGAMPPQFQNGPDSSDLLDDEDIEDLLDMAQDPNFIRDASGYGNNADNPTWGTAGYQFIRLTDPHYTDGEAGIRQTALTPREISDILSNQDNDGDGIEESIVNAFGGTSLLTFFGQYFDHGLDFVAKGQPGSVAIGSDTFPINAPRSNIVPGTGVDGIPAQYINHASPYIDQNQAYGSHDAITDVLRRWEVGSDGSPVQTAYLLAGDVDSDGYTLLPTLYDIRANYRIMTDGGELTSSDIGNYEGTGQPLLIDFIPKFVTLPDGTESLDLDLDQIGHYFVTGDGRANENVMLTSIHTIWHRNHNYWVDELKDRTNNEWTEEEYFQAARMRNIAEYQRVVFTEFTTAMAGGFDDAEEHGFEGYDPDVDASISVEFAQAAYRFGHSMLNETVSYTDENGDLQEVSLVQAFLNPAQVINLGVGNLLAGSVQVEHQAIDENVVNALRNQLVGRPLDLAALNIFRGRDMGIAPFNSVRTQLYEQTNLTALRPYTGWADFALRNGISSVMLAKLQEAYPDGFETMDLWIGGLLEKPVAGQLGSTFGYIFLEQMNRLQHGDRLYYLEIFDDSLFRDGGDVTFADIIARNTGLTDLPENVFDLNGSNAPAEDVDTIFDNVDPDDAEDDDTVGQDDDSDSDDDTGSDDDDEDDDSDSDDDEDDDSDSDDDDDEDDDSDSDDDEDDDSDSDDDSDDDDVDGPASPVVGTPAGGVLMGTSGADLIFGMGGVDFVIAGAGADVIRLAESDDFADAGAGNDVVWAGEGDDDVLGGDGNDMLYGEAGDDWVSGDAGDDMVDGGAGNDELFGGDGDDKFIGRANDGDDLIDAGAGNDTLDLGTLSEAVHVDLGTGVGGRGHVTGSQSGTDTLYGVENVTTGSGNDTIVASNAVNIMDGGGGEDVFVFGSAAAADGDTILNFEAGDKLDLAGMLAGDDSFTLVNGAPAAGQITVTHEVREDGEYTVVTGNVDGGDADFSISVTGNHNLTSSDFNL
jgi:Ca2+-binding RTX toxin-like protein